jgi:hypothetical protein
MDIDLYGMLYIDGIHGHRHAWWIIVIHLGHGPPSIRWQSTVDSGEF